MKPNGRVGVSVATTTTGAVASANGDASANATQEHGEIRSFPPRAFAVSPVFRAQLLAWGATSTTFFYNAETPNPPNSFFPPTGCVVTFPATRRFTRDFCVEANVAFGVSVFQVAPRDDAHVATVPELDRHAMAARVNKTIADDTPHAPRFDSDPSSGAWWPSLGRGGRVGLYVRMADNSDHPEWYVVVFAGLDKSTLRSFDDRLIELQDAETTDPTGMSKRRTTFEDVVPAFRHAEALSAANRKRIAAQFADCVGFTFVERGEFKARSAAQPNVAPIPVPIPSDGPVDATFEAARRWWRGGDPSGSDEPLPPGVVAGAVPWGVCVPHRAVTFSADPPPSAAGYKFSAFSSADVDRSNPTGTPFVSAVWNTLRAQGSGVTWYSDCSPCDDSTNAFAALYGSPTSRVFCFRWDGKGYRLTTDTQNAFPCVVPSSTTSTTTSTTMVRASDPGVAVHDATVFCTDPGVSVTSVAYMNASSVQSACARFPPDFHVDARIALKPVLVRCSNVLYNGSVISVGAQTAPTTATPARMAQCALRDDAWYVSPTSASASASAS